MRFLRVNNPNWRDAEHPGYGSKKEEARGGTRRAVAREKIADAVTEKITRRERPLPRSVSDTAAAIKKEKQDREQAQALAAAAGVRVPSRRITGRDLKRLERKAKAAQKQRKADLKAAKKARKRR